MFTTQQSGSSTKGQGKGFGRLVVRFEHGHAVGLLLQVASF